MTRHGRSRLERWYRCARPRGFGLRALDVERRREACALARRYEAQRFALRSRYRSHRVELAQRADKREVVRCDVADDEQANATRDVLGGARVGVGGARGWRAGGGGV